MSKNGGALTIRSQAVTASTYDAYGNYRVTLSTTDTNTLGCLRVQFIETATCLPVWVDFMVLPATVYAAIVDNATTAAGGLGDIQRMAGTALTARDIGASVLLSSGTGTGQLDFTSGVTKANVTQWIGTAASTPTVAGVPNVNAKTWNDLTTVALPLIPTVAGRTLDVSAGGEAGVDWANVGSPTTTVGLSGTTVGALTTYTGNTLQTGDAFARIGAAGASLTDLGGMSTTMKAQVNTEVVDALDVDTYAEIGQGAPAATNTIRKMLSYLFKAWRNKTTQTATTYSLFADDTTTVDQKSTCSDDATTYTRGEVATGP